MSEKAIFLDRDGTLIEDPGYLNNVEMVKPIGGAAEALMHLKKLGYKLVVVSNQSGVARGIIKEEVLNQITDRMKQIFGNAGAYIDRVYYCPYHPEGVIDKYRKESDERKPMPGMLLRAAREMDIDLARSWAIGDSYRDIEAGHRAGCRTILLNSPPDLKRPGPNDVRPDFEAVNMKEAANIVRRQDTMAKKEPAVSLEKPEVQSPGPEAIEAKPEIQEPEPEPEAPTKEEIVETEVSEQDEPEVGQKNESERSVGSQRTEELLEEAVRHLKGIHQQGLFEEFSALKLIAGILQMLVLFCILMAGWLWLSSTKLNEGVFVALGFGILFQLMALTLHVMQGRN
jgi:D-glycero-D-manno-heptose 1,7-bisphosphate phosphatase